MGREQTARDGKKVPQVSGEDVTATLREDDIGRCDLCGTEEGERWQRFSDGAWLCDNCSGVPVNETDADWIENRGVDSYDLVDPRWL